MVWVMLFAGHFLYAKTLEVDHDWAEQRTAKIADRATDLAHIESIRERYEDTLLRSTRDRPEAEVRPKEP